MLAGKLYFCVYVNALPMAYVVSKRLRQIKCNTQNMKTYV